MAARPANSNTWVPEALALGADTLVSIGGVQSNHRSRSGLRKAADPTSVSIGGPSSSGPTRQVAAKLGLRALLVQENWVDWPDAVNDRVGNITLSRIMGAEVRLDQAGFDIGFRSSWEQAISDVTAAGGVPYLIPAGALDHWLRGLGFANWADEVARQEAELGLFFDTVVVCAVAGSTQAGMVAGFAAQDRRQSAAHGAVATTSVATPQRGARCTDTTPVVATDATLVATDATIVATDETSGRRSTRAAVPNAAAPAEPPPRATARSALSTPRPSRLAAAAAGMRRAGPAVWSPAGAGRDRMGERSELLLQPQLPGSDVFRHPVGAQVG